MLSEIIPWGRSFATSCPRCRAFLSSSRGRCRLTCAPIRQPFDIDGDASPVLRQLGQYQGAGVLTGLGLLRWHLAQRKRLPLLAVFGRTFFPVLGKFFAIGASTRILSERQRPRPIAR